MDSCSDKDGDGGQQKLCCAICLQSSEFVRLPCCETIGSTTKFCLDCVRLLCEKSDGRCPKCRAFIGVQGDTVVKRKPTRRCLVCHQEKEISQDNVCASCLHGLQHRFRYTCERCSRTQQIPHPMYRYQQTPTSYSTVTWACHQGCGDYTHWRILPSDLDRIPDPPEAWNALDVAIARVRDLRNAQPENPPSNCTTIF